MVCLKIARQGVFILKPGQRQDVNNFIWKSDHIQQDPNVSVMNILSFATDGPDGKKDLFKEF